MQLDINNVARRNVHWKGLKGKVQFEQVHHVMIIALVNQETLAKAQTGKCRAQGIRGHRTRLAFCVSLVGPPFDVIIMSIW